MPKTLEIRFYSKNDYSAIERIMKDGGYYYQNMDSKELIDSQIDIDPKSLLVAEESAEVVGTVTIMENGRFAFIFRLAVHKKSRARGVGSLLIEAAEEELKSRGIKTVFNLVEDSKNDLHSFYERRGYSEGIPHRWKVKSLG